MIVSIVTIIAWFFIRGLQESFTWKGGQNHPLTTKYHDFRMYEGLALISLITSLQVWTVSPFALLGGAGIGFFTYRRVFNHYYFGNAWMRREDSYKVFGMDLKWWYNPIMDWGILVLGSGICWLN